MHYTNGAQELDVRLRDVEVAMGVIEHKQASLEEKLELHNARSLERLDEIKDAVHSISDEIKKAKSQLAAIETEKSFIEKRNEKILKVIIPVFAGFVGIAFKYLLDLL